MRDRTRQNAHHTHKDHTERHKAKNNDGHEAQGPGQPKDPGRNKIEYPKEAVEFR